MLSCLLSQFLKVYIREKDVSKKVIINDIKGTLIKRRAKVI